MHLNLEKRIYMKLRGSLKLWLFGGEPEVRTSVRVRTKEDILRFGPTPAGTSKLQVPLGTQGTFIAMKSMRPPYLLIEWDNGERTRTHRARIEFVSF